MGNQWYVFDGAEQKTKDFFGRPYTLVGKRHLLKIKQPWYIRVFQWIVGQSWYAVDGVIINCYGYIEQRCLQREEDYCANLPVW